MPATIKLPVRCFAHKSLNQAWRLQNAGRIPEAGEKLGEALHRLLFACCEDESILPDKERSRTTKVMIRLTAEHTKTTPDVIRILRDIAQVAKRAAAGEEELYRRNASEQVRFCIFVLASICHTTSKETKRERGKRGGICFPGWNYDRAPYRVGSGKRGAK